MKAQDIRKKKDNELKEMILQNKKELMNLRFQKASSQLESTARFKVARREIARIKTILNERLAQKAS